MVGTVTGWKYTPYNTTLVRILIPIT